MKRISFVYSIFFFGLFSTSEKFGFYHFFSFALVKTRRNGDSFCRTEKMTPFRPHPTGRGWLVEQTANLSPTKAIHLDEASLSCISTYIMGQNEKEKNPWSNTIRLPNTEFAMRAQLPVREPQIIEYWKSKKVYQRILEKRRQEGAPHFILHDGPPYANGNFHVGHALNKILKDVINKYEILQGKYAPYVPGWDCHGLPIELAALKKLANRKKGEDKDPQKVREACRKYAADFIQIQAADQTRFGVLWNDEEIEAVTRPEQEAKPNFYYTMSADYEAGILTAFRDLFAKGYIYKGLKPVYWDTKAQTAMAEAEIEYENHTSPSIYVKFPVKNKIGESRSLQPEFVAIWTTTPWTLPANLAVCFHPEFSYQVYKTNQGNIVIAEGLEESFFENAGLTFTEKEKITAEEVQNLEVSHPFLDQPSTVVFGRHVTLEAGTGVVHTAPGHGLDDYNVGLEYDLDPYSPVDHRGRYTADFAQMEGEYVFDANPKIIELLKEKNALIHVSQIEHSYPHSWRSHSPLIFRATPQWFLQIEPLRKEALNASGKVEWIPAWGQNRFESMVENRPDWCLSRQRHWGVPIPAFSCTKCGHTHMDTRTLDHIIQLVRKEGIEIWFNKEAKELLPENISCEKCQESSFSKENDILDVWFDSGVSWYCVTKNNEALSYPADMYLEGSDQHRGWFQSSLWPSIGLEGKAPYKKVLTHGYVLDDKGRAMSKSLGNVISPVTDIIPKYGADILRLWVSSEDYRTDNRIGFDMLEQLSDSYRKIRNTFRYILGNLNDGAEAKELNEDQITEEIDLWVLHELSLLDEKLRNAYEKSEYHQVYQRTLTFCTVTLSNTYFDIVRDRLYCDASAGATTPVEQSPKRASTLATLKLLLEHLAIWLSPVLSFTAEEIHQIYAPGTSVFENLWPNAGKWKNETLAEKFKPLWELKDKVNIQLEEARNSKTIKASLEAAISLPEEEKRNLPFSNEELAFYFVVSDVQDGSTLKVEKSSKEKCPRCWIYRDLKDSGLCPRCSEVLQK